MLILLKQACHGVIPALNLTFPRINVQKRAENVEKNPFK